MRLNWLAYNYRPWDGYGRYSLYLILALRDAGVEVIPNFAGAVDAPAWLRSEWAADFSAPTISCLPPYYLRKLPPGSAPHWLLTMTEGSECPDGWVKVINESGVERVIVPCEHNARAFREGGVSAPVSVIHGGADPDEFPLITRKEDRPYTFLALADRGKRKGWVEVYQAFFQAFAGVDDVRLIIKCRPGGNDLIDFIVEKCANVDPRITFLLDDLPDIADFYAMGDCFVIPSRSEGWGMPHREAAMMGLPVITQAYSGMDDGHTEQWAIVVEKGRMEPVETLRGDLKKLLMLLAQGIGNGEELSDDTLEMLEERVRADAHLKGEWRVCDRDELSLRMRQCYDSPEWATVRGRWAAKWLRENQTWGHSAAALVQLLRQEGVMKPYRELAFTTEGVMRWPI